MPQLAIETFSNIISDPQQIQTLGNLFGHEGSHDISRMWELKKASYEFLEKGTPLKGPDMALILGLCSYPEIDIVEADFSTLYAAHGTRSSTAVNAWLHASQLANGSPDTIRSYWVEGGSLEGKSITEIGTVLCKQFYTMVGWLSENTCINDAESSGVEIWIAWCMGAGPPNSRATEWNPNCTDYTTGGIAATEGGGVVREVQVSGAEGLVEVPLATGYPEGLDSAMEKCLSIDAGAWQKIAEAQETINALDAMEMQGDQLGEIMGGSVSSSAPMDSLSGSLNPVGGGSANCHFEQFEILRLVEVHPFGNFDISITTSTVFMLLALGFFVFMFNSNSNNGGIIPGRYQSSIEILYITIYDMVKENSGSEGLRYFPVMLILFLFLLIMNLFGFIPYTSAVICFILLGYFWYFCRN